MPSALFAFKQFTIHQNLCAMKVGTDAVLLGAWVKANDSKTILDVGTGTGVIALMMAQKTQALITAIDIDEQAVAQATQNVTNSVFFNRVIVEQISFQCFANQYSQKFDLIISNPPYFEQSLKSTDEKRSQARHADVLPFDELIDGVIKTLHLVGRFCLVLPKLEAEKFRILAEKKGLFLSKLLRVKSRVDKEIEKRHLMQFEFKHSEFSESTICIEELVRHTYTPEYIELTKDYYVNF